MKEVKGFGTLFDQLKGKDADAAKKLQDLQKSKDAPQPPKVVKQQRQSSPPVQVKKPAATSPVHPKKPVGTEPTAKAQSGWVKFEDKWHYICDGLSLDKIEKDFEKVKGDKRAKVVIRGVREHCVRLSCIQDRNASLQNKLSQFRRLLTWMERVVAEGANASAGGASPTLESAPVTVGSSEAGGTKPIVNADPLPAISLSDKPANFHPERFTSSTQFSTSIKKKSCDVVIGLDFGTSCTKVVVNAPYENQPAWIVPFGPFAHPDVIGFLPTHISLSEDNQYFFPETGERGTYGNLKMELIRYLANAKNQAASSALSGPQEMVIAYLALLFRYVRKWFMTEQRRHFDGASLEWHVNIGVPSNPTALAGVQEDIFELYRKVGCSAWLLSVTDGEITRENIRASWEKCRAQNHDCSRCESNIDELFNVYPELVGEVAGYALSKHREEGLHLMIDVGAGTLDVCSFNLAKNKDGDDIYPLLAADVQPHGVGVLDMKRRRALMENLPVCMETVLETLDPVSPVPMNPLDYLTGVERIDKEVLDEFEKLCRQQIRSVVVELNRKSYPLSQQWKNQLPVFLCGGGSGLPFFQGLMEPFSEWLRGFATRCDGITLIQPQKPENLKSDIDSSLFYRFSVAWGLSRPSVDIGRFLPPTPTKPRAPEPGGSNSWWTRQDSYWLADD